jgi:hypothetical protein
MGFTTGADISFQYRMHPYTPVRVVVATARPEAHVYVRLYGPAPVCAKLLLTAPPEAAVERTTPPVAQLVPVTSLVLTQAIAVVAPPYASSAL